MKLVCASGLNGHAARVHSVDIIQPRAPHCQIGPCCAMVEESTNGKRRGRYEPHQHHLPGRKGYCKIPHVYEGLGFVTPNREENPPVVFFDNGGTKLELCPLDLFAEDIDAQSPPPAGSGFGGITLAFNAKSKEEADAVFERVVALGGKIAKQPQKVFWGGYSGYFQDLDGYYWEVVYWDGWKFDANDMIVIEQ